MANYGLSAFNKIQNPNSNNGFDVLQSLSLQGLIKAVRVKSIVLDESHPLFKEVGEWNGLGTIEYQEVINPNEQPKYPLAKPLSPNNKKYPLINEIVFLISLPNTSIGDFTSNQLNYYIDIVGLWNHPHHNGFPENPSTPPPSQQKDYVQTQAGNVRRVTDQSTEINLGKTFKERSNIHPLLPFEGDTIYEGRWGNSIRIGSTVPNTPNNWSSLGSPGDPLTILRNGQGSQSNEGWIPTVEDINNDDSSIYLTSTQNIPLEAASSDYTSYNTNPPVSPKKYSGKQIILSSGRLVLNTTNDHLLLSSNKSINLNALNGINIDTNTFTVQSTNIYLGSKSATEPLLLGNQTVNLINQLISTLSSFATVCSTLVSTPPGTPLAPLNLASTQLVSSLNALKTNLTNIKSKYNYTV